MFSSILKRTFGSNTKKIKLPKRWKIVTGDLVYVNSGKDKGKTGEVLKVDRQRMMVQVDGVAINMKRKKGDQDGEETGGLTPVNGSIHYSNVNLVDPETGLPTRISYGFLEDGTKVRVSKKSGSIIHKPTREDRKYANRTKNIPEGPLDTPADRVVEVTY